MNGNGQVEAFELEDVFSEFDDDDEGMTEDFFDDDESFAEFDDDDESFAEFDDDDEALEGEDAEFIGSLLGGAAIRGIGSLFRRNKGSAKKYRRGVRLSAGRPVTRATLQTPRGTARLRLPTAVVARSDYLKAIGSLRAGIKRNTGLINNTQKHMHGVRKAANRAGRLAAANRKGLSSLDRSTKRSLGRLSRKHKADLEKLKQEQSSQGMMNMLMGMMQQQQLSDRIDDHTHTETGHTHGIAASATATASSIVNTAPPPASGGDNNALFMLPLLMGQQGGSSDNNMMPMMMMMMAMQS